MKMNTTEITDEPCPECGEPLHEAHSINYIPNCGYVNNSVTFCPKCEISFEISGPRW
jgi:C4-type Zn-finger protein